MCGAATLVERRRAERHEDTNGHEEKKEKTCRYTVHRGDREIARTLEIIDRLKA